MSCGDGQTGWLSYSPHLISFDSPLAPKDNVVTREKALYEQHHNRHHKTKAAVPSDLADNALVVRPLLSPLGLSAPRLASSSSD